MPQTWVTINMIDDASLKHSRLIKPRIFDHIHEHSIQCKKVVQEKTSARKCTRLKRDLHEFLVQVSSTRFLSVLPLLCQVGLFGIFGAGLFTQLMPFLLPNQ